MKKTLALFVAAALAVTALCACLTVSAEVVNLAEGATVIGANPTVGNEYIDKYNTSLVDGKAAEVYDPNGEDPDREGKPSDWFAFYVYPHDPNSTQYPGNAVYENGLAIGSFTIDLGLKASVESVRVHMITGYAFSGGGVNPPMEVKAEYSTDNASWAELGTVDDFSSYNDIDWVEVQGDVVEAQYIKVSITYSGYTLQLNEVQVMGTPKDDGTGAEFPTEDSSEPEEPENPVYSFADINGDGEISATDYMLLKRAVLGTYVLNEEQQTFADINHDGTIDATDYMLLKRAVLGTYVIK